ncbi:hypothetical protein [Paenibacillus kobensis]|uniref:hypothetical protein n=1 Tax=Paenibacillus kobensis TaxID=59841 RepID=UPI0013E305E3|nr:hypothetical protein [Paenibacillus kobensis]
MKDGAMKLRLKTAGKKTWTAPHLAMLEIRATAADEPLWEFASEGEFWKRQLLLAES